MGASYQMAHDKTEEHEGELDPPKAGTGISNSPMEDAEWRMMGLRHAMGFCIISASVAFQLGIMSLDLGYDLLGFEMASISAMAIFALMAGWRSHDLSNGKRTDMGILFLAYQEGRELIVRLLARVMSILAIAESITQGCIAFAVIILIVGIVISEADKFIVMASYCGYQGQTIDSGDEQTTDGD